MSAGMSLVEIGLQGDTLWSEIDAVNDLTFAPEVRQVRAETAEAIEVSPVLLAIEGLRSANALFVENSSSKRKRQDRMADHLKKAAIETRIEVTNNNRETEALTEQLLKADSALKAALSTEATTRLRKEKAEKVWAARLERYKAMLAGLGTHIEAGLGTDIAVDTDIETIELAISNLVEEAGGLLATDSAGQSKLRESLGLVLKAKKHHVATEQIHDRAVNALRLAKQDYDEKMHSTADKTTGLTEKAKIAAEEDRVLTKHGMSIGFEVRQRTLRERLLGRFSTKQVTPGDKQ